MSSVINLCDSSEEEDVKDTKTRPPSDDSSSSSLDDDILYAPGIFSQSSNTSKPTIKKNDKGQGVAAAVRGMKGDGSPQKPLTIKEDYYEVMVHHLNPLLRKRQTTITLILGERGRRLPLDQKLPLMLCRSGPKQMMMM
jgi:hypothetical protein